MVAIKSSFLEIVIHHLVHLNLLFSIDKVPNSNYEIRN